MQKELNAVKEMCSKGIEANLDSRKIIGGSGEFMKEHKISVNFESDKSLFFYAEGGELKVVFELEDRIKKGAKEAIESLQGYGLDVVMLTGDNEKAAKKVAQELGIKNYRPKMSPQDRLSFIENAQQNGKIIRRWHAPT